MPSDEVMALIRAEMDGLVIDAYRIVLAMIDKFGTDDTIPVLRELVAQYDAAHA